MVPGDHSLSKKSSSLERVFHSCLWWTQGETKAVPGCDSPQLHTQCLQAWAFDVASGPHWDQCGTRQAGRTPAGCWGFLKSFAPDLCHPWSCSSALLVCSVLPILFLTSPRLVGRAGRCAGMAHTNIVVLCSLSHEKGDFYLSTMR